MLCSVLACVVCLCTVTVPQKQRPCATKRRSWNAGHFTRIAARHCVFQVGKQFGWEKKDKKSQCKTFKTKTELLRCVFYDSHPSSAWGSGCLLHYKSLFHRRHFNSYSRKSPGVSDKVSDGCIHGVRLLVLCILHLHKVTAHIYSSYFLRLSCFLCIIHVLNVGKCFAISGPCSDHL